MEELVTLRHSLSSAFKGRRVLVTGGAGFTGVWLVTMLDQLGAIICSLGTGVTRQEIPKGVPALTVSKNAAVSHVDCDVRNFDALCEQFSAFAPEIVIHLAAQPLVLDSYERPYETMSSNVTGTLNVLEASCGVLGVETVLIVTSDKVYQNDDRGSAMVESGPLRGSDPYSSSKVASEAIALGYAQALQRTGPKIAVARAGNIVGGGDWSADRLIPDFMRAVARGDQMAVRNPTATRPWQHVLDACAGYLKFIAFLRQQHPSDEVALCPALNLGPNLADCISVGQVLSHLGEMVGQGGAPIERGQDTVALGREKKLLQLCTDQAEQWLGWKTRLSITQTLDLCWKVYGPQIGGAGADAEVSRQVDDYLAGDA